MNLFKFLKLIPVLIILVVFISPKNIYSQAVGDLGATTDGNWSTVTWMAWDGSDFVTPAAMPTASDNVWIPNGITVDMSVAGTCQNIYISGTLSFSAFSSDLNCQSFNLLSGGTLFQEGGAINCINMVINSGITFTTIGSSSIYLTGNITNYMMGLYIGEAIFNFVGGFPQTVGGTQAIVFGPVSVLSGCQVDLATPITILGYLSLDGTINVGPQTLDFGLNGTGPLDVNWFGEINGNLGLIRCNDFTSSSGMLNLDNATLEVLGNWTNNGGSISYGTSTVIMQNSGNSIGGSVVTSFYNLLLNFSTSMQQDVICNNWIQIASGTLTTGNYLLDVNLLNIGPSGTLNLNNGTLDLEHFQNNGNFVTNSNSSIIYHNSDDAITGNMNLPSSISTLRNLTVANDPPGLGGTTKMTISGNITISGDLVIDGVRMNHMLLSQFVLSGGSIDCRNGGFITCVDGEYVFDNVNSSGSFGNFRFENIIRTLTITGGSRINVLKRTDPLLLGDGMGGVLNLQNGILNLVDSLCVTRIQINKYPECTVTGENIGYSSFASSFDFININYYGSAPDIIGNEVPDKAAPIVNIDINNTSQVSLNSDIAINGQFVVRPGGNFIVGPHKLTARQIWNQGSFSADATSSLEIIETGNPPIPPPSLPVTVLKELTIQQSNLGYSASELVSFPGNLTVESLTLDRAHFVTANKTLSVIGGTLSCINDGIIRTEGVGTGDISKVILDGLTGSSNNIATNPNAFTCLEILNGTEVTLSTSFVVDNLGYLNIDNGTINNSQNFRFNTSGTVFKGSNGHLIGGKIWNNPFSPDFVDIYYSGTTPDMTGNEVPDQATGHHVRNIFVDNTAGVEMTEDITVEGILTLNGDFSIASNKLTIYNPIAGVNPSLLSTSGSDLHVTGTSPAIVIPSSIFTLNNLEVSNPSGLSIPSSLYLFGDLTLSNNAIIDLMNMNLTVDGDIFGYSPTNYIRTNADGRLERNVPTTNVPVYFPVGTSSNYAPVRLSQNGGVAEYFRVGAFDGVLQYGTSGDPLISPYIVNTTWLVSPLLSYAFNIDMELTWHENAEGASFDQSNCYISVNDGSNWLENPAGLANNSSPFYSRTLNGISNFTNTAFSVQSCTSPPSTTTYGNDVCFGSDGDVVVENSQIGVVYTVYSGGVEIDSQAGTGTDLILTIPAANINLGANSFDLEAKVGACLTNLPTVTINAIGSPSTSINLVYAPLVCEGSDTEITIEGSQSGVVYQIIDILNNHVGTSVTGNGNDIYATITPANLALGNNNFSITAFNGICAIVSLSQTIDVEVTSGPDITNPYLVVLQDTICQNTSFAMSIESVEADVYYKILVNGMEDQTINSGTLPSINATILETNLTFGLNTIKVVATNLASCSDTLISTATVFVLPNPNTNITVDDAITCQNQDAVVGLLTSEMDVEYTAYLNSTPVAVVDGTGSAISFNIPANTLTIGFNTITFTANNHYCALVSLTNFSTVTVNQIPSNNLTVNGSVTCLGSDATVTIENCDPNVVYSAEINSVVVSSGSLPTSGFLDLIIPSSSLIQGYNAISVSASNAPCDIVYLMDTAIITVAAPPNINLAVTNDSICSGESANIIISATEIGVNYDVYVNTFLCSSFSGTGSDFDVIIDASQLINGDNPIDITATNFCGTQSLVSNPVVTVSVIPSANLQATGQQTCSGYDAEVIIANAEAGVTYNAFISSNQVATTTALVNGNLSLTIPSAFLTNQFNVISFNAQNVCGNVTLFDTAVILNIPQPLLTSEISGGEICQGNDAVILIHNAESNVNYKAYINSLEVGSVTSTVQGQLFVTIPSMFLNAGSNIIQMSADNFICPEATMNDTAIVNVLINPDANIFVSGGSICVGSDANVIIENSELTVNYDIFVGNNVIYNIIGTGTNETVIIPATYLTSAVNIVSVVAHNNCSSVNLIDTAIVSLLSIPANDRIISGFNVCEGSNTQITVYNAENETNYQVLLSGTPVSGIVQGAGNTIITIPAGNLPVGGNTLTVQATNMCGVSIMIDTANIEIYPSPSAMISADTTFACKNTPIRFIGSGGLNYAFLVNGVVEQSGSDSVFISSELINGQNISTVVTDKYSCSGTSSSIVVTIYDLPYISAGSDVTIILGESVTLNATINSKYTYQWSPTTGLDNPNIANPQASPSESINYTVTVTDQNNCRNSSEVAVKVDIVYPVHVYNSFTPNGDGVNETWMIYNIQHYPKNRIEVFDRRGSSVFKKESYENDWDGTNKSNKEVLPFGTYYYIIDLGDGSEILRGTITIIR